MSQSSRQFITVRGRPSSKSILFQHTQSTPSIQQKQKQGTLLQQAKSHYRQKHILQTISCLTVYSTESHSSQSHYMLGICYMTLEKYDTALQHLGVLLDSNPQFKQNVYLLAAICMKKTGLDERAIEILNRALQKQKKGCEREMLVYRSKLHEKTARYSMAIIDCLRIEQLGKEQADLDVQLQRTLLRRKLRCYRELKCEKQCLQIIKQQSDSLEQYNFREKIKILRLKLQTLLEFNYIQKAESTLQIMRQSVIEPYHFPISQYHYYKGVILNESDFQKPHPTTSLQQQADKQQCVLQWNEVLNDINASPKLIGKCLRELSIYYMRNRDFYEALEYLMRIKYLLPKVSMEKRDKRGNGKECTTFNENSKNIKRNGDCEGKGQMKSLKQLVRLAEGVTYLMKRNFQQAQNTLLSINSNQFKQLTKHKNFLNNLYYNALGFTYFSIGNHVVALQMYQQMVFSHSQDRRESSSSTKSNESIQWYQYQYNTTLCRGIIQSKCVSQGQSNQEAYSKAVQLFQQCNGQLIRCQPYFYISVLLIQKSLTISHPSISQVSIFMKVLSILNTGLKAGQNSHMYYYRALIYLHLNMNVQALQDVDRAIQKSEDNVARYFFLRGCIFMLERSYQQALVEFSTSISIDESMSEGYVERGKCRVLIGEDVREGYVDVRRGGDQRYWKGIFALYYRDFQEAARVQGIKEDYNIREIAQFFRFRFQEAGAAGKLIIAAKGGHYSQVISLLEQALEINLPVGALQIQDILLLKSYCLYKAQSYQQCLRILQSIEQLLKNSQKSDDYGQEDERKLLMIKINEIDIYLKQGNFDKGISNVEMLCEDVYEGEIYDQLRGLYDYLLIIDRQRKQGQLKAQEQEVVINPNKKLFESTKQYQFGLFDNIQTLSEYFDWENTFGVKTKFWMPMPRLRIPELYDPNYERILRQFGVKDIENKPQAPWIRRGQYGVIFTNDIQHFENLSIYTQEAQQNRSKLKQSLQLGSAVLAKLNKISRKESQQ